MFPDSRLAGQQLMHRQQHNGSSGQPDRFQQSTAAQVTQQVAAAIKETTTLSPLESYDSLFGPLPSRSIVREQCDSPFDPEQCNSPISPASNCSTQDLPSRLMDFNPEQMNFSEIQQLWIRKDWLDIMLRVSFVAPIVLLGIIGNLIIIYSMCKFKPFRSKPTNIFILNMAVADLLTTMVCPIAALFTDIHQFYVLGSFICRFEGFVKITCLLVSSYSLIVLSLDWLLCVVKPCRTRITIKQSWLALATIWILSVLMASPLFVWRKLRTRQWRDLEEVWCCELIQYTKYYWVLITFFLIYLPTFIMTIVLVIILAQMDKYEAKLRRSCSSTQSNHSLSINMKYRRRIVKILFTYLLTSIICWTPLQFTIIYRHFRTEPVPSPWYFELAFFAQLSASLTAAMNPIIFGFLSQPFRRMVAKSLMLKFIDKVVTTNHHVRQSDNRNEGQNAGKRHHETQRHPNLAQPSARTGADNPPPKQPVSLQAALGKRGAVQQVPAPKRGSRARNRSLKNYHGQQLANAHSIDNNNKRVSFNTSLNSNQQPFHSVGLVLGNGANSAQANQLAQGGRTNAAFEVPRDGEIGLSSRQELAEPILLADPRAAPPGKAMSTTSFIQREHHLRPVSVVSMDSINIEENLSQRATDGEESEGGRGQ